MGAQRVELTPWELDIIIKTLEELRDTKGSYLMQVADPECVRRHLARRSARGDIIIFYERDTFIGIVMFSLATPWWSSELMVSEDMVLCVNPKYKGFLRKVALPALEAIAKAYNASYIVSGCALQKDAQMITNGYRKAGFHEVMPTYMKGVHDNG